MTDFVWLVLLLGCKATLILGLVAVIFALAGRRWPQNCMLWQRLGIVALLGLPVAVWALPTIGIPVLSAPRPTNFEPELERPRQLATAVARSGGGETDSLPSRAAGYPAPRAAESASRGLAPSNISILGTCLAAAYVAVAAILLIRFVGAWRGLSKLTRASSPVVDPAWQAALKNWSQVLQVARPVKLCASDSVTVPMTFCWRAPVILVPNDCLTSCDPTQRDAIVVHELTHIAHGDFFWQAMTRLAAAMYWVHPLVWLIRRQDGVLCERICDAFCSQYLSRRSYAMALVRIAGRSILSPPTAIGIPMANATSLRRRLTDLQCGTMSRYAPLTRIQRALLGGTAGLMLVLIALGTLTARAAIDAANDDDSPTPATQKPATASLQSAKSQAAPEGTAVRLPAMIDGQVLDSQDKPVANAKVILKIEPYDAYGYPTDAPAPRPWTASTDDQGRYQIETGAPSAGTDDLLVIKIQAESVPAMVVGLSTMYFQPGSRNSLPVQRLFAGRTVSGRLVDPQGNAVREAVVRFQAASSDPQMIWDSGPLPVDQGGAFSVTIPKEGQAAFAIYPRGFAPKIVSVPEKETDLGPIRVESGIALTGRVVDKEGRGVAGTVVAIQGEDRTMLSFVGVLIGTAVKTDESGSFRLPPVRGAYRVLVSNNAPDYLRQHTVTGASPPPIMPQKLFFDGDAETREVVFREADSATVQGAVRWADGTGVPGVEIRAKLLPPKWKSRVELATARTDEKGNYALRLPAPADGVFISVGRPIRAPDGTFRLIEPANQKAGAGYHELDLQTDDVAEADFVVASKE